jgi:hypothetical protein
MAPAPPERIACPAGVRAASNAGNKAAASADSKPIASAKPMPTLSRVKSTQYTGGSSEARIERIVISPPTMPRRTDRSPQASQRDHQGSLPSTCATSRRTARRRAHREWPVRATRAAPRATIRLATLAQAISSTSSTAV